MYVLVAALALLAGLVLGLALRRHGAGGGSGVPGNAVPVQERPSVPLAAQVLEALGEGVVVVDRGDNVMLANPAAHTLGALTGVRATAGASEPDGARLSTDALRAVAHQAVDAGEIQYLTTELPRGFLGRDMMCVAVTAVPLGRDDIGWVSAVALLLTDMTESRRLEDVRRDFVANVSHELKTPVGALTLLAEAIQEAADDPDAVDRFAARMQHEGQRLGRLVGELITLSRVQGAEALPEVKPVPVRRIVDEAIDRTRLAAERVGITVTASVPAGLAVLGDESQLTTALTNLTDNAVSYSPGGTRVVLSARGLPAGPDGVEYVELAVTDQGIGIAEADRDRIFERFYRIDPARSRATGGTGLGLAIVKHIVTNHAGSVRVWSSEGSGSTFSIRLRRTSAEPGSAAPYQDVVASTKGHR